MKRVGVDIGGTFTDLVVFDEVTGALERTKTLTTPRAPEDGFLKAVADIKVDADEVSHFLHGTTLVTNLIIERTGAKLGLITTQGFRDVLEIQRSYRDELYNLQWDKPKALVPRHLRLTDRREDRGRRHRAASGRSRGDARGRPAPARRRRGGDRGLPHQRLRQSRQ